MKNNFVEDRVYFILNFTVQGKNSRQEPVTRTTSETVEESCLLAPSRLLAYFIQDHLPRDGSTHNELGPPMSIVDQENGRTGSSTGHSDEGILS